jgi:DNA-binding response OmpR family regulator
MVGGWEVLTAPSGREGLALAASTKPDVILLDVMMPDLDGVGTFRLLQADDDPVICGALSAGLRARGFAVAVAVDVVQTGSRGMRNAECANAELKNR